MVIKDFENRVMNVLENILDRIERLELIIVKEKCNSVAKSEQKGCKKYISQTGKIFGQEDYLCPKCKESAQSEPTIKDKMKKEIDGGYASSKKVVK